MPTSNKDAEVLHKSVNIRYVAVEPNSTQLSSTSNTIVLAYFILGTLNNLLYVVILSSAHSIAASFDALRLIGLIAWANVFCGLLIRVINTMYWLDTSSNTRVVSCSIFSGLATLGLALSVHISFTACIACIIVLGCCSSLAESVILGYMKLGQSNLVGYWSSGTGMAGVAGTLIYLTLYSGIRLDNSTVYLILFPTCLLYYSSWRYIHSNSIQTSTDSNHTKDRFIDSTDMDVQYTAIYTPTSISIDDSSNDDLQAQYRSKYQIFEYILCSATQLAAVYMFEYVVSIEFASRSNPMTTQRTDWAYVNAYEILAFMYQFGVLLARSSIQYIQIKRIYILTLLQAINFIIWCSQVYTHWMPLYVQFAAMIYVGILGGLMYVNVFALLMNDHKLTEPQRELAVNYTQIAINIGIVASSAFDLVFDRFVLHP